MQQSNTQEEESYTEIFAWGADRYGQLGLGNENGKCYPVPRFCSFSVIIKAVSCGDEHSALITGRGEIFTVGSNSEGRLGLGDLTMTRSSTPCFVETLANLTAIGISCGWGHTAAVMSNGDLYTWGVGEYGALGIPETGSQWAPVKVLLNGVIGTKCGTRHTAIVDNKGRLFMCGSGDAGQLGTGSRERELVPKEITSIPEQVEHVSCSIFHTLVLTKSGDVYAMGGNNFGQLGTGNKRSAVFPTRIRDLDSFNIVKVVAGKHSAAVTDKGEVFIWGTGIFGEYLSPIPFGKEIFAGPIKDVSIGGSFGAAIDYKGALYTWGSNTNGELGMGDFEGRMAPSVTKGLQGKTVTKVSCGGSYVIALGLTINSDNENSLRIYEKEDKKVPRTIYHKAYQSEVSNELITAIKEEQDKKLRLERQLEVMEQSQKDNENNVESMNLQEKIRAAEIQLEGERKKGYEIVKEIEGLKLNGVRSNRRYSLEQRVESMQRNFEQLKEENVRLRELRTFQKSNDDSKLSGLVREYEEKIEQEVQEKYRIIKEKQKEASNLKSIMHQLKDTINQAQTEQMRLENYYKSEVKKLEMIINEYNDKIQQEENIKAQLIDIHNRDCERIDELRRVLIETGRRREKLEGEIEELNRSIGQINFQIENKEAEFEQSMRGNDNLGKDISIKEEELKRLKEQILVDEGHRKEELDKLKRQINDKVYDNEDIQNKINVKQLEIDTLNKDVEAWKQVADNVTIENEALKKIIEVLENKNKRLADSLNFQLETREKENKSRMISLIKTSKSPLKIKKIISGSQNLQYTPERIANSTINNQQTNLIELQGNLLKALETYTEEVEDEGKPLEREEKIVDPYLQEREILREFESMVSPEKSDNVEEPRSTNKLIYKLGIESPIRKRIAKDSLNPIPAMEVIYKPKNRLVIICNQVC